MRIVFLFSLALSAVSSVPLAAQFPLIDCRDIDYVRRCGIGNDLVTSVMGKAVLIIEMQDHSLVGTLQPSPRPDGTPILPSTMSARLSAFGTVFVKKQTPQMNVDGEVRPQEATIASTLQPTREASSGTLSRALPVLPERPAPAAVTATRRKE